MAKQRHTTKAKRQAVDPDLLRASRPVEETKRDKFVRLGTARMNRVLNSIRLIGNLANPAYAWEESDIALMQANIVEALGQTLARFRKHKRGEKPHFVFGEDAED